MLARLEILAGEREAALLDAIARQQAMLRQSEAQGAMLTAYRDRLAASWQGGAVVPAGQARRAGQFAAASIGAQGQIGQAAEQAQARLAQAMDQLSELRIQRRMLREAGVRTARALARAREAAAERDVTWRSREEKVESKRSLF
jgi:hypothetical protein